MGSCERGAPGQPSDLGFLGREKRRSEGVCPGVRSENTLLPRAAAAAAVAALREIARCAAARRVLSRLGVDKRDRSLISPGAGIGFPLAFAWPCFGRIVKGLTGK